MKPTVPRCARRGAWLQTLLAGLALAGASTFAADPEVTLQRWLNTQTNLASWSADFIQTRHLKVLTQPLTAPGRVWFVAPDKFRWELGQPPQSIALRAGQDLLILSPSLKRAERYAMSDLARGPMKDAASLMDAGFPRDAAEFHRQFHVLGLAETNAVFIYRLEPRSAPVRKLLPELDIELSVGSLALSATELRFADGSRLRNDFTNVIVNPAVDPAIFTPPMGADWKITEPMKSK
jgi:outer membrane lipoprotein-sorting protein